MSMKVGRGRGKKGDGLHINRETKQRHYGMARTVSMLSGVKIADLLTDVNTRAKDKAKLLKELNKRFSNYVAEHHARYA